jgi:hypothetical protein
VVVARKSVGLHLAPFLAEGSATILGPATYESVSVKADLCPLMPA